MLDFLRRLTVRRRILGGFMILVLFVMAAIPLTVSNRNFLLSRLQQVGNEAGVDRLLLLASTRVASSRVNLMRYIQDYAPSSYEALDDVEQAVRLLLEAKSLGMLSEQQDDVDFVLDALADYKALINEMTEARQKGASQEASRLEFQTFRFGNDIGQRIEQIVKRSQARVTETNRVVLAGTQTRLAVILIGYVGMSILAVILGLVVARSITQPIDELQIGAEAFRQGNLETVIPASGSDELTLLSQTFNQLSTQLLGLYQDLEQRVSARTQRLETVATLGERLTAILDFDGLLAELVTGVKESFDYYYAHIYIIDDERKNLVMTAGYGQAGAQMKAAGHHIPLSAPRSLVARAARFGETAWVDNVREAEDWLPNPLLPNTYSEMAVPIVLAGQVVGVLDVQEDEVAGFDEGDANLFRSLANYVSVAIRNARLFAEVEHALAEAHAAQERYREQSWEKAKIIALGGAYHYAAPNTSALDDETMAKAKQQALDGNQAAMITMNGDALAGETIVAPVKLHNTAIGTLQLHSTGSNQLWTEDDLLVVEAVIDQLAQAAENLRLFDETRERAGREHIVREITDRLRAASNLEQLIEVATQELGQRLSATHAELDLGIGERL